MTLAEKFRFLADRAEDGQKFMIKGIVGHKQQINY